MPALVLHAEAILTQCYVRVQVSHGRDGLPQWRLPREQELDRLEEDLRLVVLDAVQHVAVRGVEGVRLLCAVVEGRGAAIVLVLEKEGPVLQVLESLQQGRCSSLGAWALQQMTVGRFQESPWLRGDSSTWSGISGRLL